jgi:TonB family protein
MDRWIWMGMGWQQQVGGNWVVVNAMLHERVCMNGIRVFAGFVFCMMAAHAFSPGCGGISAPSVLRKVKPHYTAEERAKGLRGKVVLSLVVNSKGRAERIKVFRSDAPELDDCAMRSLALWEFVPGKKCNQPVAVSATVEMDLDARRK